MRPVSKPIGMQPKRAKNIGPRITFRLPDCRPLQPREGARWVYRYVLGQRSCTKLTVTGIAFGRTSGRKPAVIVGQIIGGAKLELDLPTLVDTRLVIRANSGEANHSCYGSSRSSRVSERLVGTCRDVPSDRRHAALLARRLLEYKVSAVIDLYELKLAERRAFRTPVSRVVEPSAARSFGGRRW
jgi:hypothetical protein